MSPIIDMMRSSTPTGVPGAPGAPANIVQQFAQFRQQIADNRYAAALQAQTAQAQMAACCCDIKTAVHAEGEQTRALIRDNEIQTLRDNLTVAQSTLANAAQTQNIIGALAPRPVPAYTVTSPYVGVYGGGCACGA